MAGSARPAFPGGLEAEAFAAAMAPFRVPPGACIAVAVSGGADSMALALLLRDWAESREVSLRAVTVDHQLRPESAAEAAQVSGWLAVHNISHQTLVWPEGATLPRGHSLQKAARDARYELMTAWCRHEGCTHLFLAHHADDQVETFLIRLSRGSGINGLAAMSASAIRSGVVLARPLLGFPKSSLLATCRSYGQSWVEDPSNRNPAGTRVRFREASALLAREGLTRDRLLATVGHLQRAREALDHGVDALLRAACTWDRFGVARLQLPPMLAAPSELSLRALARVLIAAGGQDYGPRFENLSRLHGQLVSGPWRDATLHGCVIVRSAETLLIHREAAQISDEPMLACGSSVVWDGRFTLSWLRRGNNHVIPSLRVARFASAAQRMFAQDGAGEGDQVPVRVRETLPALFDDAGLAAVPHLGYVRADLVSSGGMALEVSCISAINSQGEPDAEL